MSQEPTAFDPDEDCTPAAEPMPADGGAEDVHARSWWEEWTEKQLEEGRTPDEVTADLLANGWSDDQAYELVEPARRRTRHLRGVFTRDEAARSSEASYRQGMAAGQMMASGGIFGAAIQAGRVLFRFLASARRRSNEEASDLDRALPPAGPRSVTAPPNDNDAASPVSGLAALGERVDPEAAQIAQWDKWVRLELARGAATPDTINHLIAHGWRPKDAETLVAVAIGLPEVDTASQKRGRRKSVNEAPAFLLSGALITALAILAIVKVESIGICLALPLLPIGLTLLTYGFLYLLGRDRYRSRQS